MCLYIKVLASLQVIFEFFFFYFSKKLGRSGDGKRSIKLGWPRGKTAKNGSVSAQRSTWQGAKHLKIAKVCFNPLIFEKSFLEIYIKFTCWWLFCCRSAKHFHIVLCVWICNSELRHGRILVTPCSFYVLLQCNGIARCFFWLQDACWVTKLYRKPELSRLLWLVQGAMWFRHGSTKTWNPECGIRKRNHGNVNGNGIRERRFQAIDLKKKT